MLEALGESGKLVLNLACRAGEDRSSPLIGSEHLLLAIVELEDAVIQNLFREAGVDPEGIAARFPSPNRGGSVTPSPPFSTTAEQVLELARKEARELNHALIEAPHILIGVASEKNGTAAALLDELGADRLQLIKKMRAVLSEGGWTPGFYLQRRAIDQPTLSRSAGLLESLGRDLTESAARGELSPIVGRDQQICDLIILLSGMMKPNALLVGEPGVGKTAIVEGLAQWVFQRKVPDDLIGVHIRTVEVGPLMAGTALRGQLEQRLQKLIEELSGRSDVILFLDEIHFLVGAGASGPGATGVGALLRPLLGSGELKMIGTTSPEAFDKYLADDAPIVAKFQKMLVEEPSRDQAITILDSLKPKYQAFHRVEILEESVAAAVDLAIRYIKDRCLPDKALDVLDRACTRKRLAGQMGKWMPELALTSSDLIVRKEDVVQSVAFMLGIPVTAVISD